MLKINKTHDAAIQSWVDSANQEESDFPIQNLPFAVFRRKGSNEAYRGGVAIGDQIVDLAAVNAANIFTGQAQKAVANCAKPQLNEFMAMGKEAWSALRIALFESLSRTSAEESILRKCLVGQAMAEYDLPCIIGDYTDFYTSVYHATTVGSLFRPDNPLLPNYKWVPIGYHGRSSSIAVSGQSFHRPVGQTKAPDSPEPSFGPSKRLDYELEVGIYIGKGNELGDPISIDEAEDHVFGLCLFNDWSARDIQAWEYQPLGPFLAKNFASTISPWIVTTEALAPYRTQWKRDAADPQPLPYLDCENNHTQGAIDIRLEVLLETESIRKEGSEPNSLSKSSFVHSYWSVAQMVAHHTVNGCNLNPGDFFGSGTQSGPTHDEAGTLLELTLGGKESLQLDNGETRTFLEDGDAVIMRGWCEKQGMRRIGFGETAGLVLPAKY